MIERSGSGASAALGGRAIIAATREPHQAAVLDAIRELGVELQVIFNKGAVMVLPSGVNKATGLPSRSTKLGLRRTIRRRRGRGK